MLGEVEEQTRLDLGYPCLLQIVPEALHGRNFVRELSNHHSDTHHVTAPQKQIRREKMAPGPIETAEKQDPDQVEPKKLPKGVVLGPDGKP
jgi:hypothetical protein